jgi:magnesium-transporting ATPase (P-type)
MSEASSSSATAKISTFMLMIIFLVLALSIVAIALAVNAFMLGEETVAGYLLVIGFIAMTLSAYVLLQSRRRVMSMKIEKPSMMTTIECRKCGTKNMREFQRGDYVFKELGPCEKCPDDKLLITAIYKEIKEKEKTFPF